MSVLGDSIEDKCLLLIIKVFGNNGFIKMKKQNIPYYIAFLVAIIFFLYGILSIFLH